MRVLIIDDDSTPRTLLKKAVTSKYPDAEYVECDNGQKGIEAYEADQNFDFVFIDYVMPEKDGYAVVQHIRGEMADKDIPLIMCTSKNERQTVLKLIKAGVTDYLKKPFEADKILFKIERVLSRKEMLRQKTAQSTLRHGNLGDDVIDDSADATNYVDLKAGDGGDAEFEISDDDIV